MKFLKKNKIFMPENLPEIFFKKNKNLHRNSLSIHIF